jgi:hypothetical protein
MNPPKKNTSPMTAEQLHTLLFNEMKQHSTIEDLNRTVIIPFISALEEICDKRQYVINTYGEASNLVFSTPDCAEQLYEYIDDYLNAALPNDSTSA